MSITILTILVGLGVMSLIALTKTRAHNRGLAKEEQKQAVAKLVDQLKKAAIPVLPYPLEKEAEEKHQQHLEVKELVQKAMAHNSKVLKAKKQPQTEVWVAETKETKPKKTRKPRQKKTNITAGATNTTKAAGGKEGGKPSVVASSDFVGFNFRNSEVNYGAKATGGYTALRWDGQRSWGGLADYTSALKGPNITGFYAWIKPRSIALASSTLTVGFEGNKSVYGTLAGGQMFTFPKIPRLKVLYMGTVSYGFIYREQFIGTAVIAGAMYDMKLGKRIDIKLMNLMVYSPYVSYYNDLVLQSPYVMLPSIGTNIGITKRFKFNINGGGAWDLKTAALNYTVTCGTRLLIGQ